MRNNIRKTIAFSLTLCAVSAGVLTPNAGKCALSPTPIVANAADTYVKQFTSNSITYKVYKDYRGNQYAAVSKANSSISNVTLGANIYNSGVYYPITKIEANAFNGCTVGRLDLSGASNLSLIGEGAFRYSGVTSVTIGSSMKIDEYAFADTSALETVTLNTSANNVNIFPYAFNNSGLREFYGNGATLYFQREAFSRCVNLNYVRFGSSVKTLSFGDYLFFHLNNLQTVRFDNTNTKLYLSTHTFEYCGLRSISLPNTVTSIPESCFSACQFTSFTLPDSVKEIGPTAFGSSTLPSTFTIGKNVASINNTAFLNVSGIRSFSVNSSNAYYKSENGVLYNRRGTKLLCYPPEKTDSSFTTYATDIPNAAIANNKYLRELKLMSMSRYNGANAEFAGLDNLEYLTVPQSDYSKDSKTLLTIYKTLLTTTKVHSLNGQELVTTPYSGAEPEFCSKIQSLMNTSFDEYEKYYFMTDYVDKMAEYVVRDNTDSSMTPIQKALHLRKWIINRVNYDYDHTNDHKNHVDASVFLNKGADGTYLTVCDGFARCYDILMQKAGFESYYIYDSKHDREDEAGHAWNLIKLNNKWYHVDITWDDSDYNQPSTFSNRYDNFLCCDTQFNTDNHATYDWRALGYANINKYNGMGNMDNRKLGDLNSDGQFTSADVNKLRSYIGTSNNSYIAIGDLDFDGRITSTDADLLQQFVNDGWKYYPNVRVWRFAVYEN